MPDVDWTTARVAILGLGREGRAAWEYLRKRRPGLALALFDEAEPGDEFRQRLSARDRLVVGPLRDAPLGEFDLLLRSPGISPYRDSIRRARRAGARVTGPGSLWFADHPDRRTICITGTKGKSTTSALVAHLLESAGLRVCLAGNIGRPLLSAAENGAGDGSEERADWWVVELSSYQLSDLEARPSIALILNLTPEHLDWHGGEARYRADKLRLAELAAGRPLVLNAADPLLSSQFRDRDPVSWFNAPGTIRVDGGGLYHGEAALDLVLPEGLPGAHNLSNVAAALTVVKLAGLDVGRAAAAVSEFHALPHRLQLLGERNGVRFVNDSISSTPVATVAALEAYRRESVVLLVGGLDRGLDWSPYMADFQSFLPRAVIALPDNGPQILDEMRRAGLEPPEGLHAVADLEQGTGLAAKVARNGDVVLLSPGAPSFPKFRDYRDRGNRFARFCGFEGVE